jgi:hypothetical protein
VSLLIFVLLLGFAFPIGAKRRSAHAFKSRAGVASDAEYIIALNIANQFLHAWQTQDHETGLMMLTDEAKRHTTEARLDAFFSAEADTQQAFEINHGKKVKSGRYEFPVALLEVVPGKGNAVHRRFSQIIVTRAGKNDWAVDNLP